MSLRPFELPGADGRLIRGDQAQGTGRQILFITGFLSKRWGIVLAYLASALVFASIHIFGVTQGAVALIVPIFFIALVLAWGMHRTGSLLPGIVAHSLFNSVQLVALIYCINNAGACPNL